MIVIEVTHYQRTKEEAQNVFFNLNEQSNGTEKYTQ